jgi:hypothetical protein
MAEASHGSALAERRITTADANAELRRDVLEEIDGLLTGILRCARLIGNSETVHRSWRAVLSVDAGLRLD